MQTSTYPTPLKQMESIIDNLSPEQIQELERFSAYYTKEFNNAGHPFKGLKKMYAATDNENESTAKEATCKKGCAFCCSIRVAATELEAQFIVHHCKQNNIEIDKNKLQFLQDLNEQEYMFSPHKRCTFLAEDNSCKIYEVRPFSCRNYYVANDPKLCNVDKYPHGHTAGILNLPAALPAVAVISKYPTDNLAKHLLKFL